MKRKQSIGWGILIATLVFGYTFFESFFPAFIQIIYGFDSNDIVPGILRLLVVIGLYFTGFILLIRNSTKSQPVLTVPGFPEMKQILRPVNAPA